TFELFHGTIDRYTGNFSAYRIQQKERVLVQRRTWEKQRDEIAKMEDFIRRNHYGEKHAQAEDRQKKLDRMERVSPPREITPPPFFLPEPQRSGDIVLRVEGLAKSFDRPLFEHLTFDLTRGQRWAILGPNGCGKTTLLRCILGKEKPDRGRVVVAGESKIGYFDQHLATLDPEMEVADAVRPLHKELELPKRRDHLARFGIVGDDVFKKIGTLSGGERCRVALARLAVLEPNVLILDEPTNHLDLWARDALEQVLRKFTGTVLFISHDRFFVNQVADHLLVVEPGRWRTVDGNYQTYEMLCEGGSASGEAMKSRQTGTSRGTLSSQNRSSRAASQPSGNPTRRSAGTRPTPGLPSNPGTPSPSRTSSPDGGRPNTRKQRHRGRGAAERFQSLIQSPGPTGEDFANLPPVRPWDPRNKVPIPSETPEPENSARRRRKYPYRKVEEIEADIATDEKRIEEIHQLLTRPEILRDKTKVQDLHMELDSLKLVLAELYDHWEESMELNW
ncbi:MAG: ATP-binding cassette domain-containing protein, partial [Planctomycetia bacterium]|nr:ATP-binding cassette domain-containing protein [Planctomycetia bacterium]